MATTFYMCADLGVNWHGDRKFLEKMVEESAEAGVDAVKLQLFNEDLIADSSYRDRLKGMILTVKDVKRVAEKAIKKDIGLIVTPMYPEILEDLKEIEDRLAGIKIRAADWTNIPLIERAKREFELPVYISVPFVGGSAINPGLEAEEFAELMRSTRMGAFRIYCVPEYPTTPEQAFVEQARYHDGFSNHCPYPEVPYAACLLKAMYNRERKLDSDYYVEVHVLGDGNEGDEIDDCVSITMEQLAMLCGMVRRIETILGP